jgi:hypothetical protein
MHSRTYWGIVWRSENKLEGKKEFLVYDRERQRCGPALFETRREARRVCDEHYGYIRERRDLGREPHGWKMPRVVRVTAIYEFV